MSIRSLSRSDVLPTGAQLARSTLWNGIGFLLPGVAALIAVPPLIRGIGLDRFGVLTLAWVLVGYFGLFDFGLGRALTKMVADKVAAEDEGDLHSLIWSSTVLLFFLGVLAAFVMSVLSPWLVHRVLKIPDGLKSESLQALWLLAWSIPVVTCSSGFRGVLEALQRFRMVNLVRVPMAIAVFVGPLLVLPFTKSLVWVFLVLVIGRVAACIVYLCACLAAIPALRLRSEFRRSSIKPVLQFGGWLTISNIVSPLMVSLDRFVIGAMVSLAAVAYYATPFEMVTKLQIVPMAMTGVMFPAFASSYVVDPGRSLLLMTRAVKYVFLALFPIALLISTFAPELLRLWLGNDFATNSTAIVRWLSAGVLVNCVAQIALSLIQAVGRPDISAKLHLAELPLYLVMLYAATKTYGAKGAAIAWTARVVIDAILLFAATYHVLPHRKWSQISLASVMCAAVTVECCAAIPTGVWFRSIVVILVLSALGVAAWFKLLREERVVLRNTIFAKAISNKDLAPSEVGSGSW